MSDDPIRSTDAPDITCLDDRRLTRRYVVFNDLADALDLRWYQAPEGSVRERKLLHTGIRVRNEVTRIHGEVVARGIRIAMSAARAA